MSLGPCAKRRVRCTIVFDHGQSVTGENLCKNAQPACPRSETDDYSKCKTVCDQIGHAEEVAVMKLRQLGWAGHGGTAFLQGHHYACHTCRGALAAAGVHEIFIGQHRLDAHGKPIPNAAAK